MSETSKVAPADEQYAHIGVPEDEKQDGGHEGIHPGLVNPDQPTFPAPLGVDRESLKDVGVDHLYMPGGGAFPAAGEGKPTDPEIEDKDPSSAEMTSSAN